MSTSEWSTPVPFRTRTAMVSTPTIINPINYTNHLPPRPTFTSSEFEIDLATGGTHLNSDWMVASDPFFQQLVAVGTYDGDRRTVWTPDIDIVVPTIYVKVRYRTDTNIVSEWSPAHTYGVSLFVPEGGFIEVGVHEGYRKAIAIPTHHSTGIWGPSGSSDRAFQTSFSDGKLNTDRLLGGSHTQTGLTNWALPLLSRSTGSTFSYYGTTGADIYVIDTGIREDHVELVDRVVHLYSYDEVNYDIHNAVAPSHGTIVAGCAAGTTTGIAKTATVYNLRTDFSQSNVLMCLDRILAHHQAKVADGNHTPSIVNMSFGTEAQSWLYEATLAMYEQGIILVACSHNQGKENWMSPAIHPHVISVGAIDRYSRLASFSNWGDTVDLCAPGVGIRSSAVTSTTAYVTDVNGTSYAAPYVVGILATLVHNRTVTTAADVDEVKDTLLSYCKSDMDTASGKVANRSAYSSIPATQPAVDVWRDPEVFTYARTLHTDGYIPSTYELIWVGQQQNNIDETYRVTTNQHWWSSTETDAVNSITLNILQQQSGSLPRGNNLGCLVMRRILI